MEKYEFTATTSKSDIIIGFAFPALLMFPILGINLALFYLGPNNFIKENQVILFVMVVICLAGAYALIKKIQQSLIQQELKIEFEQVNDFWRICAMNTILSAR
ncbi:hypothetical protein ACUXZ5_03450 [Alloscardovia omnicolens]|uniref:Uncharacterized protein n=1 Tax=Alloscardovia omnicolens F0580 TaxID=1321816 RepID=U1R8N7_9BIFI|nr:hypothetical protein [Alloscardovia omnicolens]ERH30366.1 hypothetical protein HMPREF9244_01128 [Alloscardovia omnicolens F0580]MDK6521774.1 hypothetical protein [Alloscardovia omnicolens]